MAASTGRTRSSAAAVPPTMIDSVPSLAFATAPETGASTIRTPRASSAAPRARVPAGSNELMSTTIAPGGSDGSASSTASRTAAPSGSMVISTSACFAASASERQLPLPLRSKERRVNPSRARLAAMGCPMRPRPMKPTVSTSALEDLLGAAESDHRRGHAAVDGDLQEDLLDFVFRETVGERAADMQLQLVLLAERAQHAQVQDRTRLARQAGAGPDIVPAIRVQQVDELAVEVVHPGHRLVDPFGAEHLAACLQSCVEAFFVSSLVHHSSYFMTFMRSIQTLKPARSSVRNLRVVSSVSLPCASNLVCAAPMNTSGLGCTCATSCPRIRRKSY